MINAEGSKGHHYLNAESKDLKELADGFYDACLYHGFSNLKTILSPDKRLVIQNFLDSGDQSILEEDVMYKNIFNFFHYGMETMKEHIGEESFPNILKQTVLLSGYKAEEFVEIIQLKSVYSFLLEKLRTSKPLYNANSDSGHELLYLDGILCRKENTCVVCSRLQGIRKQTWKKIQRKCKTIKVDENNVSTYSTI